MCDCPYPMKTRIGDVVIDERMTKSGTVTVDRFMDCLMCGPSVERLAIRAPRNEHGQLAWRDFYQPWYSTGGGAALRIYSRLAPRNS